MPAVGTSCQSILISKTFSPSLFLLSLSLSLSYSLSPSPPPSLYTVTIPPTQTTLIITTNRCSRVPGPFPTQSWHSGMTKQTLNRQNAICTRCTPPCNNGYKKAGLLHAEYPSLANYGTAHVYLQPYVHWTGLVGTQRRIFAWKGWYLDSRPAAKKDRYQYTK